MKVILKILMIALSVCLQSTIAMEAIKGAADSRFSCSDPCIKPHLTRWVNLCDRIAELANQRIIPLLALQSGVGNDKPRHITENEIQTLKAWQNLQEKVNMLTLEGLELTVFPGFQLKPGEKEPSSALYSHIGEQILERDFKLLSSPGGLRCYFILDVGKLPEKFKKPQFKYNPSPSLPIWFSDQGKQLRDQILPTIILQFQSFSLAALQPKNKIEGSHLVDAVTQQAITQACQQKCLYLTFEIEGLEEKLRLIGQQIDETSKTMPVNQKMLTKLTFKCMEIERGLAAANAQKSLASNTMELFILLGSIEEIFNAMFKGTQPLRLQNYLSK